jgi:S-disulfanyl-L-cysteine oxidoreductase SoxD
MSITSKQCAAFVLALLGAAAAQAAGHAPVRHAAAHKTTAYKGPDHIGSVATPQQIAGWNIDVRPDGKGLPVGHGSVAEGQKIYEAKCAMCHGEFGESNNFHVLAGGDTKDLKKGTLKTVGSYWPYATTLFDYINRAMPFYTPKSLTPNEVYAVAAYVLNLNNVVGDKAVLNEKNLPKVKMPNRNGFIWGNKALLDTHNRECMKNCR